MLPFTLDGVDYSNFHPKLKDYYRSEHIKQHKNSLGAVEFYKVQLSEVTNEPHKSRMVLDNHTNLAFHEAIKPGGAKAHITRCELQYSKFVSRKTVKFFKQKSII